MNGEPDLRMAWKSKEGIQIVVNACECRVCKNYWWVPDGEINENPSYCPFCGTHFEDGVEMCDDDSMSRRMAEVLETLGDEDGR